MVAPLEVACPNCTQQPGEDCRWGEGLHVLFHAERIEMALSISGMEAGTASEVTKPELVDEAIRRSCRRTFVTRRPIWQRASTK